jgi:imidazolonepropionase-like amidohydrolase
MAIRAAALVDPATGTAQRDVVVLVAGSRIADVLPTARYRARPEDHAIDLGTATLLPGLIDAHVHLALGGRPRATAAATVRAGFTTVADLGAVSRAVLAARDSIAAGAFDGPRVLAAGLWIGVKGGVCEFTGIGVAGGPEAFRARARENLAAGADLLKACVTGWPSDGWAHPDSVELSAESLAAIVAEGHRAHRPVVAHAIGRAGAARAVDAGVDGLAHAAYVDDALAARMRARGTWMVPTLASLTAGDTSAASRALVESVARAHRAGVRLVFGTDGGVLPHGQNAREGAALVAAGLTPAEVLRTATVDAARALGIADSVGLVRRGMVADLVAVAADPLADVGALARPRFVMARGRVVVATP